MISEGYVRVSCDDCGDDEEILMTSLAGGGYDTRNVDGRLKQCGWQVDDDQHFCPNCHDTDIDDEE